MKHPSFLTLLLIVLTLSGATASAQTGFNPEFLGNGGPGPTGTFCMKYYSSYFYQEGPRAHDAELALEPQLFTEAFTGDSQRDQFLFLVHVPVGFRTELGTDSRQSVAGLGTVSSLVHYFRRLKEDESATVWLDHGVVVGFPTATETNGLRIGGNAFSTTAFEEMFLKSGNWLVSLVPVSISYGFRDYRTEERGGLSLGLLNGAVGYKVDPRLHLGLNYGFSIGSIAGSENEAGASLTSSRRLYGGPAAAFGIRKDLFLQVGAVVDLATQGVDRGQGVFVALWQPF